MFSYAPLLVSAYVNRMHINPNQNAYSFFLTLKSISS